MNMEKEQEQEKTITVNAAKLALLVEAVVSLTHLTYVAPETTEEQDLAFTAGVKRMCQFLFENPSILEAINKGEVKSEEKA